MTIDTDGTMNCTCCLFEQQGLPCTHLACVAVLCHESVGFQFPGFSHHDICVHWRSDYMHFAYKKTTPPDMHIKFHWIAIKYSGPNLQMRTPYSLAIHPREPLLPALDRIQKYIKEEAEEICLANSKATVTYNPTDGDYTNEHDKQFDSLVDEL